MALDLKSRVWTPVGRVSFAKFFPPRKADEPNSDGTYDTWHECSLVVEPDAEEMKEIKKLEALHIQDKWSGKKPQGYKPPYRDASTYDLENPNYSWYKDKIIIPVRSKNQEVIPCKVVGKREDGKPILKECTSDDFFSGVYAKAKINMYSYSRKDSKGVACGLQNIYLVRSGEPLAMGKRRPEDDIEGADLSEFEIDNTELLNEENRDDEDY